MTIHQIGPDPEFERWLAEAAPTLNDAPATPRDAMWDEISARLTAPGARLSSDERRRPNGGAWRWPVTIAAALLLGVALDRFVIGRGGSDGAVQPVRVATVDSVTTGAPTERSSGSAVNPSNPKPRPGPERTADPHPDAGRKLAAPSMSLRLAASQTLAQAELLLVAYRAETDSADARQLGRWARDVLSSTRLLLDSRVGRDPSMRDLLEDLELVLMQIAQIAGDPSDRTERELLDRTLRERDLLPRIRTAAPAGSALLSTGTSS